MAASPFFARIRAHVLQLTASIPEGKVCTHQSMGEYLDVMPRHVAFILARLEAGEKLACPWHRVVSSDTSLGTLKRSPDGRTQAELLKDEGVLVSNNKVVSSFDRVFIPAAQLPSGLARQKRPADAPVPKQRRAKPPRTV